MIASLGCILVPLTLASGVTHQWRSGKIIGPLVLGILLIPVFLWYEARVSKFPFAPWQLLRDRGIWSALVLCFFLDFVMYSSFDYLYTILVVSVNQSIASATRITSVLYFTATVSALILGIVVYYVKRIKGFIIFACALWFVGNGLLFYFRGGEGSKAGIIGALVLWGISTSMLTYPVIVSMQSVTTHPHMATVTALAYALYRVGAAVGNSVSGAVWTQLLPARLTRNLGGNSTLANAVFADPYSFCDEYAWGTPERQAVVEAYRYIQRMETIIPLCFCSVLIPLALLLRDPVLTDGFANEGVESEEGVVDDSDYLYASTYGKLLGQKKVASEEASSVSEVTEA